MLLNYREKKIKGENYNTAHKNCKWLRIANLVALLSCECTYNYL
jgi:hypothetical protein